METWPVQRAAFLAMLVAGMPATLVAQEVSAIRPGSAHWCEATPGTSAPPARLPPDLARAVLEYDRATTRNDVQALAALVADDYLLVNSDSSLQNKQSYLADFKLPGFKVAPYVLAQPVYKVWRDAAMTGGRLSLRWTQDGRKHERLLRVVHVWAKQDGRWRLTYTQLTRVPLPAASAAGAAGDTSKPAVVYKRPAPL